MEARLALGCDRIKGPYTYLENYDSTISGDLSAWSEKWPHRRILGVQLAIVSASKQDLLIFWEGAE